MQMTRFKSGPILWSRSLVRAPPLACFHRMQLMKTEEQKTPKSSAWLESIRRKSQSFFSLICRWYQKPLPPGSVWIKIAVCANLCPIIIYNVSFCYTLGIYTVHLSPCIAEDICSVHLSLDTNRNFSLGTVKWTLAITIKIFFVFYWWGVGFNPSAQGNVDPAGFHNDCTGQLKCCSLCRWDHFSKPLGIVWGWWQTLAKCKYSYSGAGWALRVVFPTLLCWSVAAQQGNTYLPGSLLYPPPSSEFVLVYPSVQLGILGKFALQLTYTYSPFCKWSSLKKTTSICTVCMDVL